MDLSRLSRARVRPARSERDIDRAAEFLRTARVREVIEGHPEERGCARICEEGGELLAALLLDPTPLRIRNVDIRCGRILETGGEDGRIHFRETGDSALFVFMLEEFLGYLWARRYPLAFVHGELALYPSQGFVPCFFHPRVYVDVSKALKLKAPYRVRHLKATDVRNLLPLRSRHQRTKPAVYASGVPMFHHFCVVGPGSELKGYFSLETNGESHWKPKFFAPEVETEDRGAVLTVLQHCARKARSAGLPEMHFPVGPSHPVARLCLELGGRAVLRGASGDPFLDEEMVHIVDLPRFVRALAPWFTQRLAHAGDVAGIVSIDTDRGPWELGVRHGKVALRARTREAGDAIRIPHWAFVQLLVGYRGVDELETEVAPRHAEILELLLPKTRPYSMPDPDHWESVKPPAPYSKRAEAVVKRVSLPWVEVIG